MLSSRLVISSLAHVQVILTNLRVDIPRCSWSPEMYTLSCAQARLLLPVAEQQVANMMPDMSRCAPLHPLAVVTLQCHRNSVEMICYIQHIMNPDLTS